VLKVGSAIATGEMCVVARNWDMAPSPAVPALLLEQLILAGQLRIVQPFVEGLFLFLNSRMYR
jgi:hypothetical protein